MRLLRLDELLKIVGVSRATISRWERDETFPARRRIGANSVAWVEEEVREWIESRPRAREIQQATGRD